MSGQGGKELGGIKLLAERYLMVPQFGEVFFERAGGKFKQSPCLVQNPASAVKRLGAQHERRSQADRQKRCHPSGTIRGKMGLIAAKSLVAAVTGQHDRDPLACKLGYGEHVNGRRVCKGFAHGGDQPGQVLADATAQWAERAGPYDSIRPRPPRMHFRLPSDPRWPR